MLVDILMMSTSKPPQPGMTQSPGCVSCKREHFEFLLYLLRWVIDVSISVTNSIPTLSVTLLCELKWLKPGYSKTIFYDNANIKFNSISIQSIVT